MKTLSLVLILGSLASFGQALSIDLISHGTYTNPIELDGLHYVTNEKLDFQDTSGLPSLNTAQVNITDYPPFPLVGTITYSNGTDTLVLDVSFSNLISQGNAQTVNGTWLYDAALSTGAYHGFSGGQGTEAIVVRYNAFASTTLSGDLYQSVPEPSTLAVLGLGVFGIMIRKRR